MGQQKIDRRQLYQMLRRGKTVQECAEHFGVHKSSISMAKKELNVSVVKNAALDNAHRIVDKNLNTVDQLQKINDHANTLLDLLMRWNQGDGEALQVLESQMKNKKVKIGDEEIEIPELRMKDPRELALKAMAEIRGQLKLQLEIFQALYDFKAVEEFQKEVLEAIGEVDQDVRNRIIDRLNQRRAIRTAIKQD